MKKVFHIKQAFNLNIHWLIYWIVDSLIYWFIDSLIIYTPYSFRVERKLEAIPDDEGWKMVYHEQAVGLNKK